MKECVSKFAIIQSTTDCSANREYWHWFLMTNRPNYSNSKSDGDPFNSL